LNGAPLNYFHQSSNLLPFQTSHNTFDLSGDGKITFQRKTFKHKLFQQKVSRTRSVTKNNHVFSAKISSQNLQKRSS